MGALLTILVVLATSAEMAQAICNLSSNGIKACQPAAAIRNPTDQPSTECCAALAGADLSIDINRAMGLPGKCGLTMPANC
nr:unnamed protein product [Digitaria exilis]